MATDERPPGADYLPGLKGMKRRLPVEMTLAKERAEGAGACCKGAADQITKNTLHDEPERLLAALQDLTTARWALDQASTHIVERLRSLDVSWATVGAAMDLSKQAAQQRYSRRSSPKGTHGTP